MKQVESVERPADRDSLHLGSEIPLIALRGGTRQADEPRDVEGDAQKTLGALRNLRPHSGIIRMVQQRARLYFRAGVIRVPAQIHGLNPGPARIIGAAGQRRHAQEQKKGCSQGGAQP